MGAKRWCAGALIGCALAALVWLSASLAGSGGAGMGAGGSGGTGALSPSPALSASNSSSPAPNSSSPAGGASGGGASGGTAAPVGPGALVVPGVQDLDGGQQALDAAQAQHSSPAAAAARVRSRSAFAHLGAARAAQVARTAFPALVAQPAGASPTLPPGTHIARYISAEAAQLQLPAGKHGVLTANAPIAAQTGPGQYAPVDLGLRDDGSGYTPARAGVAVHIPKALGEGVQAPSSGVTLTAVDGGGAPLSGAPGALDGASVLYANTQTDTDTLVKPTTSGVDLAALLRSPASPRQLYYRLGVPQGARLQQGVAGAVTVDAAGGRGLAMVLAPRAQDASGATVPVSMRLSGDRLTVAVKGDPGGYQYPIEVDPEFVIDKEVIVEWESRHGNWEFATDNNKGFVLSGQFENKYADSGHPEIQEGQYGYFDYYTQGASHIYRYVDTTTQEKATQIKSQLMVKSPLQGQEGNLELLPTEGSSTGEVCVEPKPACAPGKVESKDDSNRAFYEQIAPTNISSPTFKDYLGTVAVYILQTEHPTTSIDKTDQTIAGKPNATYPGTWVSTASEAFSERAKFGLDAFDPGIGVHVEGFRLPGKTGWEEFHLTEEVNPEGKHQNGCVGVQCNECFEHECPTKVKSAPLSFELIHLPEGEETLEAKVEDYVGYSATASGTIKVDNAAPTALSVTGLPESGELNEQIYHLTAQATDGSGTTASSGVKSLVLQIGGREVGKASASCTPGPCTASGEVALTTENIGAGKNTLKLIATDGAGNVATKEYPIYIRHPTPLSVGPGTVNPTTGQLYLSASDVSLGAPGGGLSVVRDYGSRQLSAGAEGPLGPQWSLSLGGAEQLAINPGGSATLAAGATATVFAPDGKGGFISPKGESNLTLTAVLEGEKVKEYQLRNATKATTTKFTLPSGASAWKPTVSEGPVASDTLTYAFQTVEVEGKKITEPTEELAPVPSGVSCSPTLSRGCRALTFTYASKTSATGEAQSEWGEYNGRLMKVSFTAYNPATSAMETKAVAEYAYDSQGRLRAAWDPRIEKSTACTSSCSALKSTYGYDSEGHVTAIAPAGQQPSLFAYGTTAGDALPGRLLSVTRPAATTALGAGVAPKNTAAPTLSSTKPAVGAKISVSSNGTWSNAPLAYSYQWEDCNASGAECAAIAGAVNQAYYPAKTDEGHTLVAQVIANNATGAVVAATAATAVVATGTPNNPLPEPPSVGTNAVLTVDYAVPVSGSGAPYGLGASETSAWAQQDNPTEATAIFPPDEPMGWPAKDYRRATVYYLDAAGRQVNVAAPGGAIATTEYNETNDVIRTLSPDNRAAALKEGSKSAETAKLLDTESSYNAEGDELLETFGPQHNVKIPGVSGSVKARAHTAYYYNEGAPATGGPYRLATKLVSGARQPGKNEDEDVRVTSMGYAGQNNLGWTLRQPTSTTIDPNNGLVNTVTSKFGSLGSGNGEFNTPRAVALASGGDVYVADTKNNRVQEFSASGEYLAQLGTTGTEKEKLKEPTGVAVAPNGDVFVASTPCRCVKKYGAKGEYLSEFATTALAEPSGIAVSSNKLVYVTGKSSESGTERYVVSVFKEETGAFVKDFGLEGSETCTPCTLKEPRGIAVSANGAYVYIASTGNDRVEQFTASSGVLYREVGSEGSGNLQFKEPAGIAVAPGGNVYVADTGNDRVQELTASEEYVAQFGSAGTGNGQLQSPSGVAFDTAGDMYVADTANNRIEKWGGAASAGLNLVHTTLYEPGTGNTIETRSPAAGPEQAEGSYTYAYKTSYGKLGTGNGEFSKPFGLSTASNGNVYVADTSNNRVQELTPTGEYLTQLGGLEGLGKLKEPKGVAVSRSGNVFVTDTGEAIVKEYNEKGEYVRQFASGAGTPVAIAVSTPTGSGKPEVFVLEKGATYVVSVYTEEGTLVRQLGQETAAHENEDVIEPRGIAVAQGLVYITENKTREGQLNLVQKFHEAGSYAGGFAAKGTGNGQLSEPTGITVVPDGNIYIADSANNRIEELSSTGGYVAQYGSKGTEAGKLEHPDGVAFGPNGHMFILDTNNNRLQKWTAPGEHAVPSQTIYYSAGPNYAHPNCGEHPEWTGLACQSQPAEQPEGTLPLLPVTTYVYNIWDEIEKTSITAGSSTRSTTNTYDEAGRLTSAVTVSSSGVSLPKVSDTYQSETGALVKQSMTKESKEQVLTSAYNTLGQLTSYTDANENTATYEYDVDGRTAKTNDGRGTQTFSYNETTGFLTKLTDSDAGAFTATYDTEGKMLTEGYPNGMTAYYTYSHTGAPTVLEYKKLTNCTENCTWFSDSITPSIHGQWLEQSSTLSHQAYAYDHAGRLTEVKNTPAGRGCTTRIYVYDEDTNRTSLTTREPNSKGECASEGGTTEKHTYDEADRLTDEGISYSPFGDIKTLSAADDEGTALSSAFYVNNQLQSQTRGEQTISYNLDPAHRTSEIVETGKHAANVTQHYVGPGSSPAWTTNTSGETTRNISGIGGGLAAVKNNLETPVLQLTNLHGDIIATAYLSETATGLASKADTSEFGVPTTSLPPKYSWLGSLELNTEFPSGIIAMGARSYVPQLGRFLQPDPRPGGSANAYAYTFGDPVNTSDPSGEYTIGEHQEAWVGESVASNAAAAAEQAREEARRAAEELQARMEADEAAERIAAEAADWAAAVSGGEEWYEEEWWEEGEWEYIDYHQGATPGGEEGRLESGVLVELLNDEGGSDGKNTETGSTVSPCTKESGGVCEASYSIRSGYPRFHAYRPVPHPYGACYPPRGGFTPGPRSQPLEERRSYPLSARANIYSAVGEYGGSGYSRYPEWDPPE